MTVEDESHIYLRSWPCSWRWPAWPGTFPGPGGSLPATAVRATFRARPYGPTKSASVNRELAVFKTIFNQALKTDKAEKNPAQGVRLLKENNERNRILSPDEYVRLLALCPAHIKPVVKVAYHPGMRQGEIFNFTWGQVDVKGAFVKLAPEPGKRNDGRLAPLNREPVELFKAMPRGLPAVKVFTYPWRQIGAI